MNFNKTVEQSPGGGLEFRYPALKFMGAVSHMFQHPKNQRSHDAQALLVARAEYARCDEAGNIIHSDDSCKGRVQEIKDQVTGYETYIRLNGH